jgi:phosphotransferase system HPr (HPr) family protein
MIEHTLPITLKLTGKNGLDPHVSAELAMTAAKFHSHITIAAHHQGVDAKSVSLVMGLGAQHNDLVELHAEGDDAQAAINALIAVIQK